MPTRREFIKSSIWLGAALALPGGLMAGFRKRQLLILHTNDFHSRMESFPADHPKYPGQGGIARLKTLIDEARKECDSHLLLDCGDVFQGTPYFNTFGGIPEYRWMNKAGYTASTLGNHDFDLGIEHLADMIRRQAAFNMVNCNYDLQETPLKNLVKPYLVVRRAGIKIGITGLGINPSGLIPEHLCKGVKYNDPVAAVQATANQLKQKEHCRLVIVLSHLGYEYKTEQIDDLKLAAKTRNIDMILGGHTHTFLDAPVTVKNTDGKDVIVNQAGWAGLRLGKITLEV